jgi:hypothetical protein
MKPVFMEEINEKIVVHGIAPVDDHRLRGHADGR